MEGKLKQLISHREQEWEKAWEKRDQLIGFKEADLRELEA